MFQELMHTLDIEKTSLAAQVSKIKMENKKNDKIYREYTRHLADLKHENKMAEEAEHQQMQQ